MVFWKTLLRWLGSLRLAVILMVALMCALVVGTLYESAQGTAVAQARVYHAWWFVALVGALAANVLAAMLLRFPFRRSQTGFVITHLGILSTLGGAVITLGWSERGWLDLAEGTSSDQMTTATPVIVVESNGRRQEFVLHVNPLNPGGDLSAPVALADGAELAILRYLPNCRWEERYEPAEPPAPPAVQLVLSHRGARVTRWLSTAPQRARAVQIGSLPISLRVAEAPSDVPGATATGSASAVALEGGPQEPSTLPASSRPAVGHLTVSINGTSWKIPASDDGAAPTRLGDTGLTIQVIRYVPHAVVGPGGKVENQSDRPVNPMVVYQVTGPKGTERGMAFARFPRFAAMHRRQMIYPQVQVRFEAPLEQSRPTGLELILAPDGTLHYLLRMAESDDASGVVAVDEPLAVDALGVDLRVAQVLPHARRVSEPQPLPYDPKRDADSASPAIQVRLVAAGQQRELWLPFGQTRSVNVGPRRFDLIFRHQQKTLPFRVLLERFSIDRYPGTQRPAMFRSRVVLTDSQRGVQLHKAIEMNDPLRYRSFDLWQSSYRTQGRQTVSVLGVSRDPGWPVVLVGYLMLMVGMSITLATRVRSRLHRSGATQGRTAP